LPFLLLAGCLIHLRELLGDRLYWRDTHLMYVPMKHYLAETIRRGELPQWWPYEGGGAPFLAQPMMSFFHPTTLAYLILPFWRAFAFQDLSGTLLAITGAWALGRELRQSRLIALVSAVVYAANGYIVTLTEHTFMKLSAGTMPWYVWALLAAERRRGVWWVAPPAVMGLLLLGGDPQMALLASFAGLAVVLAARGSHWTTWLPALVSPLVGAALAAIQLGPALGIVGETERAAPMAEANRWPLQVKHIAGFVLPIDHGPLEFSRSTVIGLAAIVLICASLALLPRRTVAGLWVMTALGLWLALGDDWGLNLLARKVVPFWGQFRYPIKASALIMLGLSLLAGEGFRALARRPSRRRALTWGVLGGGALFLCALSRVPSPPSLAWQLGSAAIVAITASFGRPRWLRVSAVAVLAVAMIPTAITTLKMTAPSFYDPPPLAEVLRSAGVGLTGPGFERIDERHPAPEDYPFVDVAGVGGNSDDFGAFFDLPDLSYYSPGSSRRLRSFFGQEALDVEKAARLDGIFGIGFFVVEKDLVKGSSLPTLGEDRRFGYVVIPNRRTLPRAYGVHRALPVADVTAAVRTLKGGSFKPGREILLEGTVDPAWAERPDQLAVPLQIVRRTNNSVTLDAELPWPGFAVLNETAYPGWSAMVDGAMKTARVANGLVRAVEVPQGRHRIEWRYQTPGLLPGVAISVSTLLLLAAVGFFLARATSTHRHTLAGQAAREH
jgi:hypothetical protein